ncbi:MAG: hypothetical protein ACJ762_04605 [Solirubrobacteraceae bacterium]
MSARAWLLLAAALAAPSAAGAASCAGATVCPYSAVAVQGSPGVAAFNQPSGVAVDGAGNAWIADRANNRVVELDAAGNFVRVLGKSNGAGTAGTGNGEFNGPEDVAIDFSGRIWVADTGNHRLQLFSAAGGFIRKLGRDAGAGTSGSAGGEFNLPASIVIDGAGNLLVAEAGNHRIQRLNEFGGFLGEWGKNGGDGTAGSGNGEFNSPRGIALDNSTGDILVADTGNHRVQRFTFGMVFVAKVGAAGLSASSAEGEFAAPRALEVGPAGDVFVADTGNDRIERLTSGLAFVANYGTGSPGSGQGEYDDPRGVAFDVSGRLLVAEAGNRRVQRLQAATYAFDAFFTTPRLPGLRLSGPGELAVDHAGNVWVADSGNNRVLLVAPDGTVVGRIGANGGYGGSGSGPGQLNLPLSVAVAPDDTVWVADGNNCRIQHFQPDGTFLQAVGSCGLKPNEMMFPAGLAVAGDGSVYVADRLAHRISHFDATGQALATWGRRGGNGLSGSGPGQFNFVSSIDTIKGGFVVADRFNNRIETEDGAGVWQAHLSTLGNALGSVDDPTSVRVDRYGSIVAVDTGNGRLMMWAPDGTPLLSWGAKGSAAGQFTAPDGVALLPGSVVVSSFSLGNIQRFAIPPATAVTLPATGVAQTQATLAGSIDAGGGAIGWQFEWGPTSDYGHTTAVQIATGAGTQPAAAAVSGLESGATYHYRVVARSAGAVSVGADLTFSTAGGAAGAAGQPGTTGTVGHAGAGGAAGAAGPAGPNGGPGPAGSSGTAGKRGRSRCVVAHGAVKARCRFGKKAPKKAGRRA